MALLGRRMLAIFCVAAGVVTLAACAKKETTVTSPGGTVTVTEGDNGQSTTTVKSNVGELKAGKGVVDAASLGLPVYPGATASDAGSMSIAGTVQGDNSQIAVLETTDPFDKVYDYYRGQMPAGSGKMKMEAGGSSFASFEVDDTGTGEIRSVMISSSKGKTGIELMHATKKQ